MRLEEEPLSLEGCSEFRTRSGPCQSTIQAVVLIRSAFMVLGPLLLGEHEAVVCISHGLRVADLKQQAGLVISVALCLITL